MNLTLPEAEVCQRCAKMGVAISAVEPLPSGGTHLVCTTIEGADQMRQVFAKHVVSGKMPRFAFYRAQSSR